MDGADDDLEEGIRRHDSTDSRESCPELELNRNSDKIDTCARFLLSNSRSLVKKTDAFESLSLDFACITETWFKGGKALKEMITEIEGASGIRILHTSRDGRG